MNTETRWEGAVLEKLTSNGERIAVVENKLDNLTQDVKELKTDVSTLKEDVSTLKTDFKDLKEDVKDIKSALGWLKWIGSAIVTIALALVANGISSIVF
ncbi:MAG: hypothetical protein AAGA80_12200 [Cyanobacteria bacterium P01_F01_bin.143]